MIMWDEIKKAKSCEECPYKLGIIKTFVSPCPQCPNGNKGLKKRLKNIFSKDGENPEKKGKFHKE